MVLTGVAGPLGGLWEFGAQMKINVGAMGH